MNRVNGYLWSLYITFIYTTKLIKYYQNIKCYTLALHVCGSLNLSQYKKEIDTLNYKSRYLQAIILDRWDECHDQRNM